MPEQALHDRRMPSGCAAIVLAAGASTRLGHPKQLVRIDGESLLHRTVRLAIEAGCSPVFVVLGDIGFAAEIEAIDAEIVFNPDWPTGMASSLKCGLRAVVVTNPEPSSVMVLVCDQPRLNLALLRSLIATHTAQTPSITASRYSETVGVPAIFSGAVFPELMELTGDQGARGVLQRHRNEVAVVDFPGGALDIDTPADLAKLNM